MTVGIPGRILWPGRSPKATLVEMAKLVRKDYRRPIVFEVADAIATTVPEKNPGAIAAALLSWTRAHTHFVPDPDNVELLRTPAYMIAVEQQNPQGVAAGDCDDIAMLTAALCLDVGLPAVFCAESYQVGGDPSLAPLSHVYTATQDQEGRWVAMDTQRPPESGLLPFTRRVLQEV